MRLTGESISGMMLDESSVDETSSFVGVSSTYGILSLNEGAQMADNLSSATVNVTHDALDCEESPIDSIVEVTVQVTENEVLNPSEPNDSVEENQRAHPFNIETNSLRIDLEKLCTLLEKSNEAGNILAGQDAIVFIGESGVGKTTTLLHLFGVDFKENDDFEFVPTGVYNHSLVEEFKISGGAISCTRSVQAKRIEVDGKSVTFCDTPGFSDTEGIEFDLANAVGLVNALHRAKSVKPIVVLNKNCVEDRFQSLSNTIDKVLAMTNCIDADYDFSAFGFLFTNCTRRDCAKIRRKFELLRRDLDTSDHPKFSDLKMKCFIDALLLETSSQLLFVDLEESNRKQLLHDVMKTAKKSNICDPVRFFKPSVLPTMVSAFHTEWNLALSRIEQLIYDGNFDSVGVAIQRLIQLKRALTQANIPLADVNDLNRIANVLLDQVSVRFTLLHSFELQSIQLTPVQHVESIVKTGMKALCPESYRPDFTSTAFWTENVQRFTNEAEHLRHLFQSLENLLCLSIIRPNVKSTIDSMINQFKGTIDLDRSGLSILINCPISFCWNLFKLHYVSKVVSVGCGFCDSLVVACNATFAVLNHLVVVKLREIKQKLEESILNIRDCYTALVSMATVALLLEDIKETITYEEILESLRRFVSNRFQKSLDALSLVGDELSEQSVNFDFDSSHWIEVETMRGELGQIMGKLVFPNAEEVYIFNEEMSESNEEMYTYLLGMQPDDIEECVTVFDSKLKECMTLKMESVASTVDKMTRTYLSDFDLRRQYAARALGLLIEILGLRLKVISWNQFDRNFVDYLDECCGESALKLLIMLPLDFILYLLLHKTRNGQAR